MQVFIGVDPGYRDQWHVFPFAKTLITHLEHNNIPWTNDPDHPDNAVALLVQWATPLETVQRLKQRNIPVVHRLDGRAKALIKVYDKDEENRQINELADWTVFQSDYVRRHTTQPAETIFGTQPPIVRNPNRASIIYNGVDRAVFNTHGPAAHFDNHADLRFLHVAFTANIRKGVGDVVRIAELLANNPRIRFTCLGRQTDDAVWGERLAKLPNVDLIPPTADRQRIAEIMRASHALLFPSRNDYCPNTVLEALSCGLPVIYHPSGGTPEIVKDHADNAGVPMSEQNPVYPLHAVAENQPELARRAAAIAERSFTMQRMGDEYLALFRKLIAEKSRRDENARVA